MNANLKAPWPIWTHGTVCVFILIPNATNVVSFRGFFTLAPPHGHAGCFQWHWQPRSFGAIGLLVQFLSPPSACWAARRGGGEAMQQLQSLSTDAAASSCDGSEHDHRARRSSGTAWGPWRWEVQGLRQPTTKKRWRSTVVVMSSVQI